MGTFLKAQGAKASAKASSAVHDGMARMQSNSPRAAGSAGSPFAGSQHSEGTGVEGRPSDEVGRATSTASSEFGRAQSAGSHGAEADLLGLPADDHAHSAKRTSSSVAEDPFASPLQPSNGAAQPPPPPPAASPGAQCSASGAPAAAVASPQRKRTTSSNGEADGRQAPKVAFASEGQAGKGVFIRIQVRFKLRGAPSVAELPRAADACRRHACKATRCIDDAACFDKQEH